MMYSTKDITELLTVNEDDIANFVISNNIKSTKNGLFNEKSYQTILDFFDKKPEKNRGISFVNGIPYFESPDGRVKIYRDDVISFLKTVPANSVDLIITDPAYSGMNQKLKLGSGKIIGEYKKAGTDGAKWFEEFHDTEDNYKSFLQECYRVLKNNRHIYIMFDSFSLLSLAPKVREVFEVKNVLCWDKVNIGLGHYFRRRHEFIVFASKGKRTLNSKSIPDVWKIKRVVGSQYPTQKPTEVFEIMIKGSAEKDFIVCDPFIGSGSSAIAAIKNDCKFLGCDISEKSVSFSKERITAFLKNSQDPFQKNSLVGDDELIIKLFSNAKSQ